MPTFVGRSTAGVSYNNKTLSVTELFDRAIPAPNTSSGVLDSLARDSANSTTTTLRAGLVVAKKTSDGNLYAWGVNFAAITSETASGDGSAVRFNLAQDDIVPGSVTCTIGTVANTAFSVDYDNGVVEFKTAPASGTNNIDFAYTHMDVKDGTEIPFGVLGEEINLLDVDGAAQDTDCNVFVDGYVKEASLIFDDTSAAEYGKRLLMQELGFEGLTPALSLTGVGAE